MLQDTEGVYAGRETAQQRQRPFCLLTIDWGVARDVLLGLKEQGTKDSPLQQVPYFGNNEESPYPPKLLFSKKLHYFSEQICHIGD